MSERVKALTTGLINNKGNNMHSLETIKKTNMKKTKTHAPDEHIQEIYDLYEQIKNHLGDIEHYTNHAQSDMATLIDMVNKLIKPTSEEK